MPTNQWLISIANAKYLANFTIFSNSAPEIRNVGGHWTNWCTLDMPTDESFTPYLFRQKTYMASSRPMTTTGFYYT